MATYEASQVRAVSIEIREKTLELYTALLPILVTTAAWTLNGLDPALPSPYEAKLEVDAYKALILERLKLEPWATEIQNALITDTLTYPNPPGGGLGVYFDENVIFDENLIF